MAFHLLAVVLLCLPAVVALLLDRTLGALPPARRFGVRAELAELRRGPVLVAVVLAVLVNAATFGVFTFLAVIGADAGVEATAIPALLAAFGTGALLALPPPDGGRPPSSVRGSRSGPSC
ncbi:hypothetical protein ACU8V6_00285 [Vibrio alginolyticus]